MPWHLEKISTLSKKSKIFLSAMALRKIFDFLDQWRILRAFGNGNVTASLARETRSSGGARGPLEAPSVGPGAYCAAPGHREYSRSSRWPLRGRWGLQSELRRPAAPLALPGTPVGDPRQLHFNRKQQITQELGDGARPRALALWLSGRPAAPLAPPGTPVGDPRHLQPGPGGRAAYPAHRPDPRAHS